MAMRMSGLMSGMDTESIVQQLVEARSKKVTKVKNGQNVKPWKTPFHVHRAEILYCG